ncbi:conserved plasmodium [Babesia ovata]|uniref:Conserved plasmodium n=1 Tax=Babesia ovata TaxID=189622 RepID=A0A2H6KEV7_9APIC|nr:conserved plasmodium [Babesia ovata]GBE61516.1 conserved plasmodium [Babesia ovata]
MFNCRVGVCARFAASQTRWELTRLTKDRNANFQVALPEEKNRLSRYALPSDPDALLVDGRRLTRGERIYQGISIGLPVIAFVTALAVPVGIVTLFALNGRRRSEQVIRVQKTQDILDIPSPIKLIGAKELAKLVHVNKPTIVVYYRPVSNDEESNRLNLLFALLAEIAAVEGSSLNVYRVNIQNEFQHFNQYLKEEIKQSTTALIHVVIPQEKESVVTAVIPPVSATSFVAHLTQLLGNMGVKFSKDETATSMLDDKLVSIKRCMFDLKMEGKVRFVGGHNFLQLDRECNKLLHSSNKLQPK